MPRIELPKDSYISLNGVEHQWVLCSTVKCTNTASLFTYAQRSDLLKGESSLNIQRPIFLCKECYKSLWNKPEVNLRRKKEG